MAIGRFMARSATLLAAVAALSLSQGCGWLMGEVEDEEVKELDDKLGKPDARLTAYDDSLVKFGRMLEAYNIKPLRVQSKIISNDTADQSLPQDISKMLATAVNKIGHQVTYIPFDPNYVISEATTGGNINRALPNIVITGGITEYDKDMIEKSREAKADAQVKQGDYGSKYNYDGGASYKAGSSVSRIALDLGLLNYSAQTAIAGIQTSNAITVRKSSVGWGVGAYFQGCGLSFDYSLQKKQGVYYALRLLVELSVLEVLGQYFDVPYWRCIEGAKPNASMLARLTEEFNDLGQADQLAYLREYLFLNGLVPDRAAPLSQQALQSAMAQRQAASNSELFIKLWSDVPIEEARRRNKDYQKSQEVALRAQQQQAAQQQAVQQQQAQQQAAQQQQQQQAAQPAAAPAPAPAPTKAPAPAPAAKPAPKPGKEAPLTLGPLNEF